MDAYTHDAVGNRLTKSAPTYTGACPERRRGDNADQMRGVGCGYDANGNQTSRGGDTFTYRLGDGLGSTATLADAAGNVTGSYSYDVFGSVRSHTGSSTEWTFTGEQNDPNGLEYLRARYYDPATGRFLGRDPLGGGYPYVGNNPVNRLDPTGLYTICAEDSTYGYVCFDSTQIGLPLCDQAGNCYMYTDVGDEEPVFCGRAVDACVMLNGDAYSMTGSSRTCVFVVGAGEFCGTCLGSIFHDQYSVMATSPAGPWWCGAGDLNCDGVLSPPEVAFRDSGIDAYCDATVGRGNPNCSRLPLYVTPPEIAGGQRRYQPPTGCVPYVNYATGQVECG